MKIYKKAIDTLCKGLEIVAATMLATMVLIIFYHVIMRYFFNQAPSWSEEVSLQLMIWFCFIAMLLGVQDRVHISIELFVRKLSPKMLFVVELFDKLCILAFGGITGYYIIPYINKLRNNKLPATGMPANYQYIILVVVGFLILLVVTEQIILQIKEERVK